MRGFLSDLMSVGASKLAIIFLGLLYSIITARYLGPELNGKMSALMVYPSLFMTIGSLGIRQSTAYYVGKGVYSDISIKRAVIQLWYLSSIVCVVSSFLLIRYFSNSGGDMALLSLALAPIPFTLFLTYNSGFFLGKNQIKEFNQINWLPSLIKFISVVVLVVLLPYSIYGAMIAGIMAPMGMSIILLKYNTFIEGFSLRFEKEVLKSLLSLGLVYAVALLVINLNYKLDVILLDKLASQHEIGIYSKGVQLVEYLWEIPMLLSTIVFARSANSSDNHAFSIKVAQLLRVSVIVVGGACLFLAIIAQVVVVLLFGNEFVDSSRVLIYLLPGVLFLTIFKVLNMDLAGRGRPWISMKAMVPALIINVIFNVILIPDFGAEGAALASTGSYTLASFAFLFFYSKETNIPIGHILTYSRQDFAPILNQLKRIVKK